jgi:hypothetical protein
MLTDSAEKYQILTKERNELKNLKKKKKTDRRDEKCVRLFFSSKKKLFFSVLNA